MNEISKAKRQIKICGWLFITQAILIAITLLMKLTVIPVDSLESDDFSTMDPLIIVGLFFIGRGILNHKEWIRGIAVWIIGLRLIVGLPLNLFTETHHSIWIVIIDAIISIGLLIILIKPNIKQVFTEKLANQKLEPTVKTPVE